MALGASKTWVAGEVLTASDLNSEFSNIYTNGEDLSWPATKTKDFNSQILQLASGVTIKCITTDLIEFTMDSDVLIRMDGTVASPVTGLDFIAGATTVAPQIKATGETDVSINWVPIGTGTVQIEGDEVATILGSQFFS